MSTRLVEATDLPKMLGEVLQATIALQRADYNPTMRRIDPYDVSIAKARDHYLFA